MTSRTPIRLSLACLAWVLLGAGSARATDDPPQGVFDEGWYVMNLQGQKTGHMHATSTRRGNEILTHVVMKIEFTRGPSRIEIEQELRYRETMTGRPLAFQHITTMGTIPVTRTGVISDGRLKLTTEQSGVKRSKEYEFDPEIKFAWGQLLLQQEHGLDPGTTFQTMIYEPDLRVDGPVEMEISVGKKEPVQVLGRMMNLTPVTTTMKLAMPLASVSWVDDEASPVVITVNLGGIEIKMFRSTKEDALGESDAPEMFVQTFVPVERRITQSAKRVKIRMRLPADSPDKLPPIPDTTMQSVRRVNDREAVVTIRRVDWKSLANVGDNPPPKDMAEFLKASTILDIDNRRIKRLARRAVKGVSTPSERADALRRYVTKYITDKSLDVGFATASEVAQTREGDCTEHGVLLAALARAAGIPARGVSGIIQIPAGPFAPSKGSAFGYHMWTQVNIGGRWIDLDAAMRQTDCDPTHIALSLMPLNEEGMVDSILALLPLLGKLQIEVIDVE